MIIIWSQLEILDSLGYGFLESLVPLMKENQRLLIEAAREIPSHLKVHFFIVGEGEETVMLKELCIKYELMDRFAFTGYRENGHELTFTFSTY